MCVVALREVFPRLIAVLDLPDVRSFFVQFEEVKCGDPFRSLALQSSINGVKRMPRGRPGAQSCEEEAASASIARRGILRDRPAIRSLQ